MNGCSLVLITVDCLRADRMGARGYSRPLTPFLDSLSEESVLLSEAMAAGAPTYFSFPSIMASRSPLALGRENVGIAPGELTLAAVLQKAGYATGAFIAGNPYLTARFGYDQGFSHFSDFLNGSSVQAATTPAPLAPGWSALNRKLQHAARRTELTTVAYNELYFRYCQWRSSRGVVSMDQFRRYPAADVVVTAASRWLTGLADQQFFLWIHLMDPHHPYYPPEEALSSMGISHISPQRAHFLNSSWNRFDVSPERLERYKTQVMALYDAGVHWVDRQISRLVEQLKLLQRWSEIVFVVTADHGEEFLEHGRRYHWPTGLTDELIHVPLLIRAPDLRRPKTVPGPFSLIHLGPTLLEALGLRVPTSFNGRGLWKEISAGNIGDSPAIVECIEDFNNPVSTQPNQLGSRLMAVRDSNCKLVLRFSDHTDYLYDLQDDPNERKPLALEAKSKERVRLLRCAWDHLRGLKERRDQGLFLQARLREIRRQIELRSSEIPGYQQGSAVRVGEHG